MHHLLKALRNNRLLGARQDGPLPATKPVSKWTGFRKIAAPKIPAPSPALQVATGRYRSPKLDRNERARFARHLEDIRRQTRTKGASGRTNQGALTPHFIEALKALAFDFYNIRTGRLDPSHETIAKAAGVSVATVRRALAAARKLGLVDWVRRAAHFVGGMWKRRSNSYQLAPRTTDLEILRERLEGVARLCPALSGASVPLPDAKI